MIEKSNAILIPFKLVGNKPSNRILYILYFNSIINLKHIYIFILVEFFHPILELISSIDEVFMYKRV